MEKKIEELKNNEVFKQILKDSFGGVCYMKKREDYDLSELTKICKSIDIEMDSIDGIVKGAIHFVRGD